MVEAPHKKIIILAGPNGAGKTTFARAFLPQEAGVPRFINADLIAAGLSTTLRAASSGQRTGERNHEP